MESTGSIKTDPCSMLTAGTGLRGCMCQCSNVVAHTLDCVGKFDARGDFHGAGSSSCFRTPCKLRRINLALELQAWTHLVLILLFLLLSAVFRGLDSLNPQLHHLFDVTIAPIIFHAKFHNSIGVVVGAFVWISLSGVTKLVFLGTAIRDFFVRENGDCFNFYPCAQGELTFYSLLLFSVGMLALNVWEIVILNRYRKVLVKSTIALKKELYGR